MAEKKVNYDRNDFERWDFYVTGGRYMGRIVACTKPFHRGDGVYKQSMNEADWRVLGNKTLTPEQLKEFMEKVHDARIKALRETVNRHKPEGYKLLEARNGYFRIVKEKKLDS